MRREANSAKPEWSPHIDVENEVKESKGKMTFRHF